MRVVIDSNEAFPVYRVRKKTAKWQHTIEAPKKLVDRCRRLEQEIKDCAEAVEDFMDSVGGYSIWVGVDAAEKRSEILDRQQRHEEAMKRINTGPGCSRGPRQ